MSIHALSWALSQETGSSTRKAVLLALADRYNEDESAAWPSIAWIARVTEVHPRTVRRAIRELEELGLVYHVGWRGVRADRQTKRYRLVIHRREETGGRSVTPSSPRGGAVSSRGGAVSTTGGHRAPRTITEPLGTAPESIETITPADVRALREAIR